MSFMGLKARCQGGCFFWTLQGRIRPASPLASGGCGRLCPRHSDPSLPSCRLPWIRSPFSLLWRALWLYWVHLNNPGDSPHLKTLNLIASAECHLSCKFYYSQPCIWEVRGKGRGLIRKAETVIRFNSLQGSKDLRVSVEQPVFHRTKSGARESHTAATYPGCF